MSFSIISLDIDINIQKNHFTYSWKPTKIKDDYDEKFLLAGDAYYIIDPDLNKLNSEQISIRLIYLAYNLTLLV